MVEKMRPGQTKNETSDASRFSVQHIMSLIPLRACLDGYYHTVDSKSVIVFFRRHVLAASSELRFAALLIGCTVRVPAKAAMSHA